MCLFFRRQEPNGVLLDLTNVIELPDSLEFLPKLIKKIKDKMKFSLQEDLAGLLYFPGHGYLSQIVVLQILEIMLESSIADRNTDTIKFEENTPNIRRAMRRAYGNLDEFYQLTISQHWPPFWPQLKLPGPCAVTVECSSYEAIQILFLLDNLEVLSPDFSLEEEQYRNFIGKFKIE